MKDKEITDELDEDTVTADDINDVLKPFSPVLYNIGLCQGLGDMLLKLNFKD